MRLRTQLVLVTALTSFALTGISLLVVRYSVRTEFRRQSIEAGQASVRAFEQINQEYQSDLRRSATLLAELPTLKAVMTTGHAATIQDASERFWNLSGTDLFVLTDPGREHALAVHASGGVPVRDSIEGTLLRSSLEQTPAWWQNGSELYSVIEQPIIAGSGAEEQVLGSLIIGRRISNEVAQQIGQFAGSEVVLASNESIVASTLNARGGTGLQNALMQSEAKTASKEVAIDGQPYLISVVSLGSGLRTPLRGYILFPLRSIYGFLGRLNQTIVVLGLLVAVVSALFMVFIAQAMTTPLERLVNAVRALAAGNYSYSMKPGGTTEVAALGKDFMAMRQQLVEMQRRRLEAERLAALGRAAGSISHDLRHHLAAVVANAEFLHDADRLGFDRDEIYREIERASSQMTALIDALLEVSRDRLTLSIEKNNLRDVITRAAEAVRANPEFRNRRIEIRSDASTAGEFDSPKLHRVFFNLLQNACEATTSDSRVGVTIIGDDSSLECLVWDTGHGVPDSIRGTLFEPFVSAGKNNGTGLGLAIAAKIVHDHGGQIRVERTSPDGTTFRISIPRHSATIQTDATAVA